MKKTICWVACTLTMCSACQNSLNRASIDAEIAGLSDSVAYVSWSLGDFPVIDTVPVKEGKFSWKGTLPDPQKILIRADQQYLEVYMENKPVTITGTIDSFYFSKVSGSAIHDEWVAFNNSLKDLDAVQRSLFPKIINSTNEAEKAVAEKQLDSLGKIRIGKIKEYVRSHPSSIVSLNLVRDMALDGEWAELDSLYRALDPSLQQSAVGQRVAKRLDVLKRSAVGQSIQDFTQNDVNGKPVRLSDFKGKYLFIDFWASWCGPCRAENPNVVKAYSSFKDKRFDILGVSLDTDADKWKKAIEEDGLPWTHVSDLKGFRNEIASYYGIQAIPFSFLLDPEGRIIAKGLRGAQLQEKLAEILQ